MDLENRLVVAKEEQEGKDWEFGISRCKLLYIGWINNKVLLYSTGNYIQYLVINHNGKEYTCITESLCYTTEINTTLKVNYTSIILKKVNRLKKEMK